MSKCFTQLCQCSAYSKFELSIWIYCICEIEAKFEKSFCMSISDQDGLAMRKKWGVRGLSSWHCPFKAGLPNCPFWPAPAPTPDKFRHRLLFLVLVILLILVLLLRLRLLLSIPLLLLLFILLRLLLLLILPLPLPLPLPLLLLLLLHHWQDPVMSLLTG